MKKKLRTETLLAFCFRPKDDYKKAAIKLAYKDFCRTLPLKKESQTERNQKIETMVSFLINELEYLFENKCADQMEFDSYHRKICENIQNEWEKLTIGHIQKWVNMTLKYWLVIGEEKIKNIKINYNFFHVPIDSIVLKKFLNEKATTWSKINDYEEYFKHQKTFREKYHGIPIIKETEMFNSCI